MIQLSHQYITTGKTIALTICKETKYKNKSFPQFSIFGFGGALNLDVATVLSIWFKKKKKKKLGKTSANSLVVNCNLPDYCQECEDELFTGTHARPIMSFVSNMVILKWIICSN